MKIKSIEAKFGLIKVNGDEYRKDIIIHADGKITKREKKKSKDLKEKYGHTPLSERELDFLPQEQFDAFYIGTGHESALPITPRALEILKNYNAVILPTSEVIAKIGQEQEKFVAIIHITC
jgi:hypothetical protein